MEQDVAERIHTAMHTLSLHRSCDSLIDALLADIEAAKKRIFIEVYIFRDDKLGTMIAEALARAAERGVPVWLLYDALGSQESKSEFFESLKQRGVFVRPYRPGETVAIEGGPFPRDHSRNFVIDDRGYTGGIAFADAWLPESRGGGGWHDVGLAIEGPAVEELARMFQERWAEADGGVRKPQDMCSDDKFPDLEIVADTPSYDSKVFNRHLERMQKARTRIHIANSYFYPSKPMLRALYDAARRGVEVKVVTCDKSDLALVKAAERSAVRGWVENGIDVHEYCRCMLHAKYAVIDDDWATVGSFNANPSSVAMANELNVFVNDRAFVERVEALFQRDVGHSRQVTLEERKQRPPMRRLADYGALQVLKALDFIAGPRPPKDGRDSQSG